MNGVHDMAAWTARQSRTGAERADVHAEWEARVLAMVRAMGAAGAFNIDTSPSIGDVAAHVYLSSSYYKNGCSGSKTC